MIRPIRQKAYMNLPVGQFVIPEGETFLKIVFSNEDVIEESGGFSLYLWGRKLEKLESLFRIQRFNTLHPGKRQETTNRLQLRLRGMEGNR